jgi:2-aminobenzoate-CoA ligase
MKDVYPVLDTVPESSLVPPEFQPEYLNSGGAVETGIASAILTPPGADPGRLSATAIIQHETAATYSFADLDEGASRLANALRGLGVKPGHRVAFRTGNRAEGIIAALGAWRAGAIVVPLPLQARGGELNYLLTDTGAAVLIAQGGAEHLAAVREGAVGTPVEHLVVLGAEPEAGELSWRELMANASPGFAGPPPDPDSVAIIWHTGGTTGLPKGCYHTHRRFLYGGYSIGAATGIRPGERWAAAAPIGHALGFIYHTIFTLLHGATIVLIEDFQRAETVLQAIGQHEVTTFTAITATWARMMDTLLADGSLPVPPAGLRSYAMWQSASSSGVYDWWAGRGIELMNNFGSTAFATWVLVPRRGEKFPRASLGKAAPGYEVLALDQEAPVIHPVGVGVPGRMAVRGPSGLTYWNRPDLQKRDVVDGWTLVDDSICFDADGNAAYLGRTDFLISTAGYKVAPAEVEAVLARHPAVREVAVMGVPDELRSEVVCAFVAVADGYRPDDDLKRELQQVVKRDLAPYKYPRRIEFVSALPRDSVGKVRQRQLQSLVGRTTPTGDQGRPEGAG